MTRKAICKAAILAVWGMHSIAFALAADTPVSVTLSPLSPGITIPSDFVEHQL